MFRSLLMFFAAMTLALPAAAESRIGVVDLRQALFSSNDAKSFSENMQKDFAGDEQKVREAQEAARSLKERLEKDGAMMNDSERNKLAGEFQEKVKEFNFLKQRLDTTVNQRKQAFLEEARPEVDAAVKELLEENDLDLILPSEAVVYVKPDMNLTPQLLEKLNR
jgi:outer membrane protein